MGGFLSLEQLEMLGTIDTCTICNAIEATGIRNRLEGHFSMDTRCLLPHLGVMLGYAVTVTVDASTEGVQADPEIWEAWLRAMETGPRPGVLVFKDIGPKPRRAAHFGEQMATISQRFGCVGIVTDGGLRDIQQLERIGFQCFGPGVVPSHGNPRLIDVNVPVEIDGVCVKPGNLLHGDANGLTTIPNGLASQVLEKAVLEMEDETRRLTYFSRPNFTIEGLMKLVRGDTSVL